jgi:tellurite resistance protein
VGYGLLVLVGGAVWLMNAAYQYIRENMLLVIGAVAITAAAAIFIAFIRSARWRRTQSATVGSAREVRPDTKQGAGYRSRKPSAATWIEPSVTVNVQGTEITTGLFYFGEAVPLPDGGLVTQYAINPALKVSSGRGDVAGSSMPYWPSYASITPQARRAFLSWMKGGRKDPAFAIGHVFMFFYGLEHRLFLDHGGEAPQVFIAEVTRLLSIYGDNDSFRGYATTFLDCTLLSTGAPPPQPVLTPEIRGEREIPLNVRLYLGKKLATGDRIGANDALLWLLCLPDIRLRTPAVRCFDHFTRLWRIRFDSAFPGGLRIKLPSARLVVTYHSASGAFDIEVPGPHSLYPDVAAVQLPVDDLQSVAEQSAAELDAFSRFVGRHPERQNSIEAVLLLPETIRKSAASEAMRSLKSCVARLLDGRGTTMAPLRELLAAGSFDIPHSGSVPRATSEQLGQALDLLDVAVEPDCRYGGGILQPDDHIVVFTADHGGPINPAKPAYKNMKIRVEVAALAAAADGAGTAEDMRAIMNTIRSDADLTPVERLRLIGYAVTIFKSPPKKERIMRRLAQTSEVERKAIAAVAAAIAGQSDQADPGNAKLLQKIHKTLKLPVALAHSDTDGVTARRDEPIAVSAESRAPGIRIPKEPAAKALASPERPPLNKPNVGPFPAPLAKVPAPAPRPAGIIIDRRRLAEVREDTEKVSLILAHIFVDEPDPPKIIPPSAQHRTSSKIDGLDSGHAELVLYLQTKGEIARTEFEARAKALHLLPDGAIDRINDWSLDRFDEELLEDGDHIVVVPHLRDRLAQMKEMLS